MPISTSFQVLLEPTTSTNEEQLYLEEWTNSSRLLFYAVISISIVTIPILLISFYCIISSNRKNGRFLPYVCAILAANLVLLATIFISVLVKNTDMVYESIPGFLVCKFAAFLVNTSSCFIYWTWVAMFAERCCYIFYPLRFHTHNAWKTTIVLICILLFSMCAQLWIPIFITEKRLDSQMDNIYCGEDPTFSSETQLIVSLECFTTFFLPFILTIFADISVLLWTRSLGVTIELVAREEIRGKNNETMKIVSSNSIKNTNQRRANAFRRCLISATLTLFLNLPNYSLQLLDEFFNFRDNASIDARRIFLRIDAVFYILYLMQFPITPIHIFTLITPFSRRESRLCRPSILDSFRNKEGTHYNQAASIV